MHNKGLVRIGPILKSSDLLNSTVLLESIISEFTASRAEWTYSHKINGRWENIYVDIDLVPSVRAVLSTAANLATQETGKNLVCGHGILKDSFWFNCMATDESTGWHNHKARAAMSGVFYLTVPKDSGDFLYREQNRQESSITPEPGMLLLFQPTMNHAVSVNKSKENRVSLAFNLFTLPLEMGSEDPFSCDSLVAR